LVLNREIVQRAENFDFDFALSMIKLRGFGGPSEFWDHNLESFTLMAGLAAVTNRINLYASVAVLSLPPAIVARMAVTIDSISHGRFGVNIVSGWQKAEYEQMGIWPGEAHFGRRYEFCAEYVGIMKELWETGRSDCKGEYFQMNDCRLSPRPQSPIRIICAGQSDAGMRFAANYGDYNFCSDSGETQPQNLAAPAARLLAETKISGRNVGALVLVMVIADETDAAAMAKWEHYKSGTDTEALAWQRSQAGADKNAAVYSTAGRMARASPSLPTNMARLIGSYAHVAGMLDQIAEIPGIQDVMLTFDDFVIGIEQFGRRIMPLMASRKPLPVAA
jgi:pyrimidine oxygenase